jgi:thiamine biosynthesis lipoprotein
MGSFFEVLLPAVLPGAAGLAESVLDLIDRLEDQLTVYRDSSEIARINTTAAQSPVVVEPRLYALLEEATALSRETTGAFDLAAGALIRAWGFLKGPKRIPDPVTLAAARESSGSHHLRLDPACRTIAFDKPGVELNLGAIGKGYALDRAAELIREFWLPTGALLHAAQSSIVAVGSPPGSFGGRWEIAVRNPFDPERPLGTLRLRNRALATSGAAFQYIEANGRRYGHIIDPRSGEPPSDGPASVTVLAPTGAEADALSTAFYLLGPDFAREYIRSHPDTAALFVLDGPTLLSLGLEPIDFLHNDSVAALAT